MKVTAEALPESLTDGRSIRIAVLPFLNASDSASSGVFAQLITDEFIHALVRTDGVSVTAASLVAPLLAKAMDIRSLARKLNVQIVIEGTVRQDNNRFRITSRVVNATDGFQIWSERVEIGSDLERVPEITERIASLFISHIRPNLDGRPLLPQRGHYSHAEYLRELSKGG
jgi:TolB-like protein